MYVTFAKIFILTRMCVWVTSFWLTWTVNTFSENVFGYNKWGNGWKLAGEGTSKNHILQEVCNTSGCFYYASLYGCVLISFCIIVTGSPCGAQIFARNPNILFFCPSCCCCLDFATAVSMIIQWWTSTRLEQKQLWRPTAQIPSAQNQGMRGTASRWYLEQNCLLETCYYVWQFC